MLYPNTVAVYLCKGAVDFRKGALSLALLIESSYGSNPLSGGIYVFYNRHKNRIKLLYWDKNGYALWYKLLEEGRFSIPALNSDSCLLEIDLKELQWLLQGLDIQTLRGHKSLHYKTNA